MDTAIAETTRKIIITHVKEVKGRERVLQFIGSTELPDRDNEVIKASAWKFEQYIKNPVVQWAHDYANPPIGKTLRISQNQKNETIFEIEFADRETYEFADTIFKLCKGGFLNATSVGFMPIDWVDGKKDTDPRRTYEKVELLEISIVPVPANPEALVTARNAGVISLKEFDFMTKPVIKENLTTQKILPTPNSGESQDAFIARCMGNDTMNSEYTDQKQRAAICYSQWRDKKGREPRATSQDELRDEIEYTLSLIKLVGISEPMKEKSMELSNEIKRLTGNDIPEVIATKAAYRASMAAVIKALNDHHDDHNKCHAGVMKMIDRLCEDDERDKPEDKPGREDDKSIERIVNELVNQKLGGQ